GQKDFQQLSIVRRMIRQLNIPTQLVMCPIIREADGLAMSSRNRRLPAEDRQRATLLYRILREAQQEMEYKTANEIVVAALKKLSVPGFKPEYFDIVDADTLLPIKDFADTSFIIACLAVWVGEIRLIDNLILKGAPTTGE
ncbi:MAG: pantoate--beta-alanine ligase, partial [Bacteroidota bacterium]